MRKNIAAVIESWTRGEAHREDTCRTDGVTVWSYAMPIARREPDGRTFLLPESKAPSRTTKMQVRAIGAVVPYAAALEES